MKHMTSVVVTTLCNQLEALASDLGDDQSRYLFLEVEYIKMLHMY